MQGIGKSFGGVSVLSDAALTVAPGEVVALLGSNGAGKSTLMKILTGLYSREAGTVAIDGVDAAFASPAEAVDAGVRLLPQEISVMPDMTVAENICLGDMPTKRRFGFASIDDAAMRAKARALLDQLGFEAIDADTPRQAALRRGAAHHRDRPRARRSSAHSGDGRADGGADRARSQADLPHHSPPQGAIGRNRLHLALPRRKYSRSPTASSCCATAATPANGTRRKRRARPCSPRCSAMPSAISTRPARSAERRRDC